MLKNINKKSRLPLLLFVALLFIVGSLFATGNPETESELTVEQVFQMNPDVTNQVLESYIDSSDTNDNIICSPADSWYQGPGNKWYLIKNGKCIKVI